MTDEHSEAEGGPTDDTGPERPRPADRRAGTDRVVVIPSVGSAVTLIDPRHDVSHVGVVRSWRSGPPEADAQATVMASPDTVIALADRRILMSTRAPGDSEDIGVTVFAAIATVIDADELELNAVAARFQEARRGSLRARVPGEVIVATRGAAPRPLRIEDLSRSGVRVTLSAPLAARPGANVEVDVRLEEGLSIHTRGKVVRVDRDAGQAVVQFVGLTPSGGERLDRYVLLELEHASR